MKNIYSLLFILLCLTTGKAQTFDFSISFIGVNSNTNNYQFALVATPSATITDGNTADMGAGFYIPLGLTIGNFETGNSNIPASEWSTQDLGSSNSSGDPYFISRVEAGSSSILLNGDGPFELVLFDVIANPNPTTGDITFVENGDPVFNELLFIENYMNINLGAGTINAYNQNEPTANSIAFNSLTVSDLKIEKATLELYPNPTKDYLNINSSFAIDAVEIFNVSGQSVLQTTQFNNIKVQSFQKGIYFARINMNGESITKKFVVY
ncbi:T9SS type A sorting domain-containing protein [Winogradskyella maritima]|uniref:T9SS type A sorting domain-containing protein n=1 Tax=Winogradskyella maritima TaxID=1517766 RepID=A0ABV8AJ56_9FLAO|nr:T9SS type A sorting domain-containing protein [Winogradskyella maritima]